MSLRGPDGDAGPDGAALAAWARDAGVALEPPLSISVITGGASNLTYMVTAATGSRVVLRRPPLNSVLTGAHDVAREYRIIAALRSDTVVPVPSAIALCTDTDVIGAPFYLMDYVDGVVLHDERQVASDVPVTRRRAIANAFVDALTVLHAVEPERTALAGLARRDGYITRQLRTWDRQWQASRTRELPVVDEVHRRLCRDVPIQQADAIVHGDYRLDNVIIDDHDEVAAIVDWELCTLGDPLADLGVLLAYWYEADDAFRPLPNAPTAAGGFPTRDELVIRYARASSLDLSELAYYVAFGCWKVAVILEGVHGRQLAGAYGAVQEVGDDYGSRVEPLAHAALELVAATGR